MERRGRPEPGGTELLLAGATLTHVALAVQSIEEAVGRLSTLGFGPWTPRWDIEVPASHRGAAAVMGLRAVFAAAGPITLELVEATNDDSPVAEHLRHHGEGVQHFGYHVEDMDATLERAEASGVAVDWLVRDEHGPAVAFLSPDAFAGVSIELVRKTPPISLDAWKRPDA
jgi:methylmalonyl-CoA epimerase